jgi:drug/metabolite transporter, DME family
MYMAVLLWGTVGPAMQLIASLGPVDGPSLGFFRLALALPAMLLASWRATDKLSFAISRADLALMLGFGLTMALFQLCFLGAITGIGATAATLISVCLPPLLVTLVASRLRGERPSALLLAALTAALAGAALTVLDTSARGLGPAVLTGGLLAGIAARCTAGGTLMVRSLLLFLHGMASTRATVASVALLLETPARLFRLPGRPRTRERGPVAPVPPDRRAFR